MDQPDVTQRDPNSLSSLSFSDLLTLVQQLHQENEALKKRLSDAGLTLTIQQDPFAISALLDDLGRQRNRAESNYLAVVKVAQAHFGDDAVRVDTPNFPTWLSEQIAVALLPRWLPNAHTRTPREEKKYQKRLARMAKRDSSEVSSPPQPPDGDK